LDFGNSILIHGGGWKKMQDQRISPQEFFTRMREQFGITRVYNYYGMVEQTGSIFMGCEEGRFHASCFSDVLVRSPRTLAPLGHGETGLLEVFSLIQHSYPGHILLTEDLGAVIGEDDCPCGRMGKTFSV